MESRNLIERHNSELDRRVRLLDLTDEGKKLLEVATPLMLNAQEKILAPLNKKDQEVFMRLLNQLVHENNEYSRAPSQSNTSY